ncbi:MAG: DUF4339 domain-containing protein [Verrucomicrobiota bacterium]
MDIYLAIGEQQSGPYTEEALRAMVLAGTISRQQFAWRENMESWLPLEKVIQLASLPPVIPSRAGLPPIPPIETPEPFSRTVQAIIAGPQNSLIRSVSGIIALLLAILTIFCIGGCINAQRKLNAFQTGSDPLESARILFDTVKGVNQNDPLSVVQGLFERSGSLQADADDSKFGAWLALIGTGVAGGVFVLSSSAKARI